jgi:hypothetical protein
MAILIIPQEVFSKLGIARLELLQKLCQMAFSGSDITMKINGLCKPFPVMLPGLGGLGHWVYHTMLGNDII